MTQVRNIFYNAESEQAPESRITVAHYTADEIVQRFLILYNCMNFRDQLDELGIGKFQFARRSKGVREFKALCIALWGLALQKSFPSDAREFFVHFCNVAPDLANGSKKADLLLSRVNIYIDLLNPKKDSDFMPSSAICFCNSNIPWGGGENWHWNAARSLSRRGHRVILLCHPRGELYQQALRERYGSDEDGRQVCGHIVLDSLTVIPMALGRLSYLNPLLLLRLKRFYQRENVQAVIMNLPSDLKAAGTAAAMAGVSRILYRRGSALPVKNSTLNRWLYGRVVTTLIVNSQATWREVLRNNPHLIDPARVAVLPNSVDVPAFDAALSRTLEPTCLPGVKNGSSSPRDTANVHNSPRPFVIGNAGRLNRQKGQHILLLLAKSLAKADLDFRIIIAGTGELESELKAVAHTLGVADRIIFPGFMNDLSPFWHSIDLFVLTSLWEGFGNVLIEAMLARKPVFTFAVSNMPELIRDGDNGRLFPFPQGYSDIHSVKEGHCDGSWSEINSSLDALVHAVLELASRPEEAHRMGKNGREFALRFSQDACMDALEKIVSVPSPGRS